MIKFDDPTTWPKSWRDRIWFIANYIGKDDLHVLRETHGEMGEVLEAFIQCAIGSEVKARSAAGQIEAQIERDMCERSVKAAGVLSRERVAATLTVMRF